MNALATMELDLGEVELVPPSGARPIARVVAPEAAGDLASALRHACGEAGETVALLDVRLVPRCAALPRW